MLRNAKVLETYALRARDGDIGKVRDFYFDDQDWHIRYFVVDTGSWLTGRRVLISPEAVNGQLWADRMIPVALTREQVKNSPSIDTANPVLRQHEMELRHHYGWPPYWGVVFPEAATRALFGVPAAHQAGSAEDWHQAPSTADHEPGDDSHLRSAGETIGYHIEAADGAIGHIDDFLVDDDSWRIRYLVIDPRNWWPGRKVIVAPGWIREVSWAESTVFTDLSRATIKGSPAYDPAQTVSADYSGQLHDYYGRPRYPDWDPDHKSAESRRNFPPPAARGKPSGARRAEPRGSS